MLYILGALYVVTFFLVAFLILDISLPVEEILFVLPGCFLGGYLFMSISKNDRIETIPLPKSKILSGYTTLVFPILIVIGLLLFLFISFKITFYSQWLYQLLMKYYVFHFILANLIFYATISLFAGSHKKQIDGRVRLLILYVFGCLLAYQLFVALKGFSGGVIISNIMIIPVFLMLSSFDVK